MSSRELQIPELLGLAVFFQQKEVSPRECFVCFMSEKRSSATVVHQRRVLDDTTRYQVVADSLAKKTEILLLLLTFECDGRCVEIRAFPSDNIFGRPQEWNLELRGSHPLSRGSNTDWKFTRSSGDGATNAWWHLPVAKESSSQRRHNARLVPL